jgi:uncharacterized OB-fold protein
MNSSTDKSKSPDNSQIKGVRKQVFIAPERFHTDNSSSHKTYLIGSRCDLCGTITFPAREICPSCVRGITMKPIPLDGKGKIDSFSISYVAPPGFEAPYIQAWIELVEGPRIFSTITECEPSEQVLNIGMEVEFVIGKVAEDDCGNDLLTYQFRPTKTQKDTES